VSNSFDETFYSPCEVGHEVGYIKECLSYDILAA